MMMQTETATSVRGTAAGRNRHFSFGGSERQGPSLTGRGQTRGSGQRQGMRKLVGNSPESFMLKQRQPDGE